MSTPNEQMVAGALIDFIGFLTTYPKEIKVGSANTVYDIHSAFKEFCELRRLDADDPLVMSWNMEVKKVHIS